MAHQDQQAQQEVQEVQEVQAKQQQQQQAEFKPLRCEARDYGDCYRSNEVVDVTFLYRDSKGRTQSDEVVKVCLCQGHLHWLNNFHQNKPLVMRGEALQYALHDDLFAPFTDKVNTYTLLKAEFSSTVKGEKDSKKFYLFNGRDLDAMRKTVHIWNPTQKHIGIYEEGFFQTTFHRNDMDTESYEQVVIEIKPITGELALDALANQLSHVNMRVPEGDFVTIGTMKVWNWFPLAENDPIYTPAEPLPKIIKTFFTEKQGAENYASFEECLEFIGDELSSLINWTQLREKSPYSELGLFKHVQLLTNALLQEGDTCTSRIIEMMDSDSITPDVLWVTYIMANHRLFASQDNKKDLTQHKELVELFITQGLEKELLTLAISGERDRYLFSKIRPHYNNLHDNPFVVEFLVPQYVAPTDIIYKNYNNVELTPLAYWHDYDNTTTNGNFTGYGYTDISQTFEKNESIRLYLEKHL